MEMETKRLILDFQRVMFMDRVGLRALAIIAKAFQAEGAGDCGESSGSGERIFIRNARGKSPFHVQDPRIFFSILPTIVSCQRR